VKHCTKTGNIAVSDYSHNITKYARLFAFNQINIFKKVFPFRPKIECVEQELLSGDTVVIAQTGDSWFNCQKLHLPENCG